MDAELKQKFPTDQNRGAQSLESPPSSPEPATIDTDPLPLTPARLPTREAVLPKELLESEPEISENQMFRQLANPGEYTFKGPFRMFDRGLRYVDQDVSISSRKGWPTVDCVCASVTFSSAFGVEAPTRTWVKGAVMGYAICPGRTPGKSEQQVIIDIRDVETDRDQISRLARLAAKIYRENVDYIARSPETAANFDPIDSACQEILGYCRETGLVASIHRGSLYSQ